MSASLVGSEMCIRDRSEGGRSHGIAKLRAAMRSPPNTGSGNDANTSEVACLLYTSDAADDM
eukprot:8672132-Alexandrium_andersonii.AAC.1